MMLGAEVKVDSDAVFRPHKPVVMDLALPAGGQLVLRLDKFQRVGAERPQGPPTPPPPSSYQEELDELGWSGEESQEAAAGGRSTGRRGAGRRT